MKIIGLIAVLVLLALCGCDDGNGSDGNEIVLSEDCSDGSMDVGIEFDSDAVRCGVRGKVYFGIEWMNELEFSHHYINPVDLYLYSSQDAVNTRDSVWILETDPVKMSACEKLDIYKGNLSGTFCLINFEISKGRNYVSYYNDGAQKESVFPHYIVYSKYGSYNAFCAVESYKCVLIYSCTLQYDGTYHFSRVPTLDQVKRKNLWCIND